MSDMTDAFRMAKAAGRDPKTFRAALRRQKFPWHIHNTGWIVTVGSSEHKDMEAVLAAIEPRVH